MELQGKTILFLGDSITEGFCTDTPYWKVFGQNTGAKVIGYGVGGTNIARQHNEDIPGTEWLSPNCFCARAQQMQAEADVVVVFGGTNDFGGLGDVPLGCMADREPDSFYGALHHLYRFLQENYPKAEIVILTPLHRRGEDSRYNELGLRNVAVFPEYVQAIRQVAAYYSLPVLDLYAMSGLSPVIPVRKEGFMPDGLHPNDEGHQRIASRLEGFLRTL